MAFSVLDGISDVIELEPLIPLAEQKFATKPTTFTGWLNALGFLPTSILFSAATLADQLRTGGPVTVDEVATLLGVDPAGLLGGAVKFYDTIRAQVEAGNPPTTAPAGTAKQPPAPNPTAAPPTANPPGTGAGGPHGTVLK